MRIAVVGAGISGLVCAHLLASSHEVALFERDARLGGHTSTVDVRHEGRMLAVDTGFIVYNERNYPQFSALLRRLDVATRPASMSFSVRDDRTDFEYGGDSLGGIVGAWTNPLRPRWWRVIGGVARLGRVGKALLSELGDDATVGDLRADGRFSEGFLDDYLVPMAAAIWSAPRDALEAFPARFVLGFFDNHGMLDLRERPQWRTIVGGSATYIRAMGETIPRSARLACPVERVERDDDGVTLHAGGGTHRFDAVILAAHSDQSLAMLADPSFAEREILGALPFQANDTVLHTDERLLPRRRRCWAAWNYRLDADPRRPVAVTYNMSLLQGLETRVPLCVTLNDTGAVDPARVIARFTFHHPMHTREGERARSRWGEISGQGRTHYCGAYWGNGFHEDGVTSALRVCDRFGVRP